jgi:hypothetical protein
MVSGESLDIPLFATDSDGDRLTLTGVDLPTFVSVIDNGDGTGFLHIQPGIGDVGIYRIYVAVADEGTPALGDGQALALTVTPPGLGFYTVTPCRVVDTRDVGGPTLGAPLSCGTDRSFSIVGGACGVPASAIAVSLNVTATAPTAQGNVRLFASGAPVPTVSSLNYAAGQTRANNAVAPLSAGGQIAVLCMPSGTTHVILDVNGYFE